MKLGTVRSSRCSNAITAWPGDFTRDEHNCDTLLIRNHKPCIADLLVHHCLPSGALGRTWSVRISARRGYHASIWRSQRVGESDKKIQLHRATPRMSAAWSPGCMELSQRLAGAVTNP